MTKKTKSTNTKKISNKKNKTTYVGLKKFGKFLFGFLTIYIALRAFSIDLFNILDCNRHVIEPFPNSTFNVLILPFSNYEGSSSLRHKIEYALNAHLNDLIDNRNFDKKDKIKYPG